MAASPWAARIRVRPLSLAAYAAALPPAFSHIICNPPFSAQPGPARRGPRHSPPRG
ncbi:MAG: hypothetical protein WKG07_14925 [Hymenobacter sp.]